MNSPSVERIAPLPPKKPENSNRYLTQHSASQFVEATIDKLGVDRVEFAGRGRKRETVRIRELPAGGGSDTEYR